MGIKGITSYGEDVSGGVTAGIYRVPPWHGVGDCIDSQGRVVGYKSLIVGDPRTSDEIRDLAGGRWEVTEQTLDQLGITYAGAEDIKLILRDDKPVILGVHGSGYGMIENRVGFAFVAEILRHAPNAHLVATTELFGGQVMFSVIEFDKGVEAVRHNGRTTDKITRYMGVYWSHNGAYCLGVKFMNELWVCRNTFTPQTGITGLSIRHTRNASDIADKAIESIEGMVRSNDEFDREVQRLLDIEANTETMTKVIVPTVLGEKDTEATDRKQDIYDNKFAAIMAEWNQFTDQSSAFDAVMAVQGWEQHRSVVKGRRDIRAIQRILRDDYPATAKAYACFDPAMAAAN
jgi:hypothetical protein